MRPARANRSESVSASHSRLLVTIYQNVRGRAFVFTPGAQGSWTSRQLPLADNSSINLIDSSDRANAAYVSVTLIPHSDHALVGRHGICVRCSRQGASAAF